MMKLTKKAIFHIIPSAPFHFDSTFFKPGHFPTNDTRFSPGKRRQTMLWKGKTLGVIFENKGIVTKPKIRVFVFSEKKLPLEFIKPLRQEIIWRYNLELDLSGFYKDVRRDKLLTSIIRKFKGLRPMHPGSLYEYLIIAITLQNATVRRSVYMMQTLFENYGALLEFNGKKLWCFWRPEVLAKTKERKLRDLKMGYRAKSLIKVSKSFAEGKINEADLRGIDQEIQKESLISLYGIGPASVGYIMFDVFHQWDYLNHISPWEQKIYTKIFFNKDPDKTIIPVKKMLKFFRKWGKWQSLAIHYVWEDIWWRRYHQSVPWLEKLVRL